MFEQDYIMRLIHEMVRTVMKLVFGSADNGEKLNELIDLADEGKINEAENRLYDLLEDKDPDALKIALAFYDHMNGFDTEFLDEADYSREEIRDGICDVLKRFGYGGMTGLFLQ